MSKKESYVLIPALLSCLIAAAFILREIPHASEKPQAGPRYNIEVILKAKSNPPDFWRIVEQGIDMASAEFSAKCTVSGPAYEKDVDRQIQLVEEALARKPDAIILAAGDVNRLVPVCEKIADAKIPLIVVDSDVNTDYKAGFVGTDNYELGQKLAELLDALISSDERFGVIGHVSGTATAIGRVQGFMDTVSNPGDRMAGLEYCDGSSELAHEQTIRMLTENPDIRCMVGLNESSSLGISTALNELGLNNTVKLVTCDSSQEQIKYMENGTIHAVVSQTPFNMGYLSVQAAVQAVKGKKIAPVINTGCIVITREDMHKQENQKLLFPFTEQNAIRTK